MCKFVWVHQQIDILRLELHRFYILIGCHTTNLIHCLRGYYFLVRILSNYFSSIDEFIVYFDLKHIMNRFSTDVEVFPTPIKAGILLDSY